MKAICLWQPYASLVVIGAKKIETRTWAPSFRGDVAVLATAWAPKDAEAKALVEPFASALREGGLEPTALPRGAVLGVVRVTNCFEVNHLDALKARREVLTKREEAFGDYSAGRWCWTLENPRVLAEPIPCRGRQGLFDLDPSIVARVLDALAVRT